ncbi:putative hydrolase of the HAD superfamily [Streptomyces sp. SceaMP-e96]|uniref:HAD family hydrolase n=1 Tax=unclassified Streptomyces TaxID=2593676 RepID=UPI0008239C5E|nr:MULTISPECIES: HAD family hydrolase [unclassified Streptomyces]MYT13893.1 HAD hydrolase-like protein [Streptomyces sp. SID4951]SCK56120.1 putative hydrolase of the HAD superfamily [Streptomyces sp. SceaMP-e96]
MLIFDADDTLWENNVIFERVIDEFLEWMTHPGLDRAGVRAVLDGIEAANAPKLGYGSKVFLHSLGECVAQLRGRAATAEESARIAGWAAAFAGDRVELIPGVAETLAELARRHDLLMLTKGDTEEQERKVAASGLTRHFRGVHIVAEKNIATYEQLKRAYDLVPDSTWMIGNSPKSDILPARSAGLNAVFIPHEHTWVLEHSDLDPADDKVLRLPAFGDLLHHF